VIEYAIEEIDDDFDQIIKQKDASNADNFIRRSKSWPKTRPNEEPEVTEIIRESQLKLKYNKAHENYEDFEDDIDFEKDPFFEARPTFNETALSRDIDEMEENIYIRTFDIRNNMSRLNRFDNRYQNNSKKKIKRSKDSNNSYEYEEIVIETHAEEMSYEDDEDAV